MVFLGSFVPRAKALNEIKKCDLAIHIGEDIDYPTIAFKVWDYLGCGKKILYLGLEESYTARFLNQNDLGIVIPMKNIFKGQDILRNLIINIKTDKSNFRVEQNQLAEFTWDYKSIQFINEVVKNLIKT